MNIIKSPYTAAITRCSFLFYEFCRVLPLMMTADANSQLKREIEENNVMQVNSRKTRVTFMREFRRRFNAVPAVFWEAWQRWGERGQRAGLLYAILKTYKLVFDFHFNVAVRHWNSVERSVFKSDVMMALNEIASCDEFVDSWTEKTKERCATAYLTILRQAGMLDEKTGALRQLCLSSDEAAYYIRTGEEWFLEACLLYPYEIKRLKADVI